MKYINIKTKVNLVVLLITVLMLNISCEGILDEQPISEIGPENFWKSNTDANLGVAGAYDLMQKTFRTNHYYFGEFRSDSYVRGSESANASSLEFTYNNLTEGNGNLRWTNLYELINQVNLAIKYIPEISGVNMEYLAEAHAIRAFTYFEAIRVWGSVPLFMEPIEGSDQELQRPRTDGDVIMQEVILPDLKVALDNMSTLTNEYRFSRSSILCLQAEVYMYLQDYAKAKTALTQFIALNEFSLVKTVTDWENLFINDIQAGGPGKIQEGPELILSINFDLLDSDRSGIFAVFFAGLPSFFISPVLEDKWTEKFPTDSVSWVTKYPTKNPQLSYIDEKGLKHFYYGDWRYYASREGGTNLGSRARGEARVAKYNKTNYSSSFDDSDIVLYRYSGMLLMLAEAENKLGNATAALNLVNSIRTARLLPTVTAAEFGATIEARENYILDESQIELLGEGKRWWDLMRTGKTLEIMNPILDTIPEATILTNQRIFSPIYQEHLIENPLLEQTPGYTN